MGSGLLHHLIEQEDLLLSLINILVLKLCSLQNQHFDSSSFLVGAYRHLLYMCTNQCKWVIHVCKFRKLSWGVMEVEHFEFTMIVQTFAKEEWKWSLSFKKNYETDEQFLNSVLSRMNVLADFIFALQLIFHARNLKVQLIIMVKIMIFSSNLHLTLFRCPFLASLSPS